MAPSNANKGGSSAGQGEKTGEEKAVRTPKMDRAKDYASRCREGERKQRDRLDALLKKRYPGRYRAYKENKRTGKKTGAGKGITSVGFALKEAVDLLEEVHKKVDGDEDENSEDDGEGGDDSVPESDGDDRSNEDDDEDEAPTVAQAITV
jgi:hypothetical protein